VLELLLVGAVPLASLLVSVSGWVGPISEVMYKKLFVCCPIEEDTDEDEDASGADPSSQRLAKKVSVLITRVTNEN